MAEADGNRTRQRQNLPFDGFEDRAGHQAGYASLHHGGHPAKSGAGGQDGPVMRMMRGPDGGPSRGLRLMALIVALALVGAAATALTPLLTWLLDLL